MYQLLLVDITLYTHVHIYIYVYIYKCIFPNYPFNSQFSKCLDHFTGEWKQSTQWTHIKLGTNWPNQNTKKK